MSTTADSKKRILEAVFRLVDRGGIVEASLRKVAEESGINIGSVRHHFGSAEGLMTAAAEEVGARMAQRLDAALPLDADDLDAQSRRDQLDTVCRAVLPLSESDRAELIVLIELISAARLRPEFRPLATRMGEDLRAVLRQVLEAARVPDAAVETERLHAVIGGLTFELVHPHGAGDGDMTRTVLRKHIAELIPT